MGRNVNIITVGYEGDHVVIKGEDAKTPYEETKYRKWIANMFLGFDRR
jgi:hypothetical protein